MNWLTRIFKKAEEERTIKATILVVDPSLIVRKTFEALFSAPEHYVVGVADETEAREQLRGVVPDVIFIDAGLAEQGGYELCKFIRGAKNLKSAGMFLLVPALSGFDEDLAQRVDADGWFTKPFESMNKVRDTVEDYLAHRGANASDDLS